MNGNKTAFPTGFLFERGLRGAWIIIARRLSLLGLIVIGNVLIVALLYLVAASRPSLIVRILLLVLCIGLAVLTLVWLRAIVRAPTLAIGSNEALGESHSPSQVTLEEGSSSRYAGQRTQRRRRGSSGHGRIRWHAYRIGPLIPLVGILIAAIGLWWPESSLRFYTVVAVMLVLVLPALMGIEPRWLPGVRISRKPTMLVTIMAVLVGIAVIAWVTTRDADPSPPGSSIPVAVIHSVWSQGSDVRSFAISPGGFAKTDFKVTAPFISSVAVNVAGVDRVQLSLIRPTPSGPRAVTSTVTMVQDETARVVFRNPLDVRQDVGKLLFLQVTNIAPTPMEVFLATRNVDPTANLYISCLEAPLGCVQPDEDMNAIVIGQSREN
jgi:hypothetical protein